MLPLRSPTNYFYGTTPLPHYAHSKHKLSRDLTYVYVPAHAPVAKIKCVISTVPRVPTFARVRAETIRRAKAISPSFVQRCIMGRGALIGAFRTTSRS